MKIQLLVSLLLVTAAGAYCESSQAQSAVKFIDGGYPELCTAAALNIGTAERVELTGSRIGSSALELCTAAIRSADSTTNLASSYNNRGVVLFDTGAFAEALSDFEEAVRLNPMLAQAHVNRGFTLIAMQRWNDSIEAFDRGIELGAPDLAKAHFNRGIAHEELGHVREAYQDYLTASQLDPLWEEPRQELTRFSVRRQ